MNKDKLSQLLKRDTFFMQFVPAALVFLALLAFAIGSWQNSVRTRDAQYNQAIDQRVTAATDKLDERIKTSGTLLRAGNGLLYGSEFVSSGEWQKFYRQLAGDETYTGACMVGYVPIVTAAERASFDEQLKLEGHTAGIITNGNPDVMAPVLYATQFDKEAKPLPHGQDMFTVSGFKDAMDKARDTGEISMTNLLPLGEKTRLGVLLFIPIYTDTLPTSTVAERQAALAGYVYESINTKKLFSGLSNEQDTAFGFTATQIDSKNTAETLYQSASMNDFASDQKPVEQKIISEYGNTWKLAFYADDAIVAAGERSRPAEALAVGIGLAVIASISAYMLLKYRTKIFAIAEEQKLQQAKDELLSLASHQLRTPATGVKQYVGMVLDGFGGPVPKQQVKLLEQAYKSNERQLQIINEFLYVAKLGSGSLITTKHKFDIAPLVRDVIEEMSLDVQEKHHIVKAKIPKSVILKADEHSVRMIVENIFSNAIKYTQPGGKIVVELNQTNREVSVVVRDNGVGIAKKDQKQLFKQFSRIPNELTNEVSGSGIGLYLAQQLAVRNGGKIIVESEPSVGSTFTLSLPNWRVKKITMPKRNT